MKNGQFRAVLTELGKYGTMIGRRWGLTQAETNNNMKDEKRAEGEFWRANPREAIGTGFQDRIIEATLPEMMGALGEPEELEDIGDGKVKFRWVHNVMSGGIARIVTVYDYKTDGAIGPTRKVRWHVGGNSGAAAAILAEEVLRRINAGGQAAN